MDRGLGLKGVRDGGSGDGGRGWRVGGRGWEMGEEGAEII